jgi:hypothetical protein
MELGLLVNRPKATVPSLTLTWWDGPVSPNGRQAVGWKESPAGPCGRVAGLYQAEEQEEEICVIFAWSPTPTATVQAACVLGPVAPFVPASPRLLRRLPASYQRPCNALPLLIELVNVNIRGGRAGSWPARFL